MPKSGVRKPREQSRGSLAEIYHYAVIFGQLLALVIRADSSKDTSFLVFTNDAVLGTPDAVRFVGSDGKDVDMSIKSDTVKDT